MALIKRCFSTSLISTFGALNTLRTSNSQADLAVTFAGERSFLSTSVRIRSEFKIDLFHTPGIAARRPLYVKKFTVKPYLCWNSDLDKTAYSHLVDDRF